MNAKRKAALACELEDAEATDSAIDCASFAEVWEEMERQTERADKAERELEFAVIAHEAAHQIANEFRDRATRAEEQSRRDREAFEGITHSRTENRLRAERAEAALWKAWKIIQRDGNGCAEPESDEHPIGCECIRIAVTEALK